MASDPKSTRNSCFACQDKGIIKSLEMKLKETKAENIVEQEKKVE